MAATRIQTRAVHSGKQGLKRMKMESGKRQKLKLRAALDRAVVDLHEGARKDIKKRSVFVLYALYRLALAFIIPTVMTGYTLIGRYTNTGDITVTYFDADPLAFSALHTAIILIIFHRITARLRTLLDDVVENRSLDDAQVIPAYQAAFKIPVTIVRWELVLSFSIVLVPTVLLEMSGIRSQSVPIREIVLSWWLGTLPLLLTSFLVSQDWVEKLLMQLYDCGLRISSTNSVKRDGSIYLRIASAISAVILTLIVMYWNIFYEVSLQNPDQSQAFLGQVAFMSVVMCFFTYVFFRMLTGSIKKSFDILAHKMKIVQGGDYSVRILNHRDDQLGLLYDDFDFLVTTLNGTLQSLEDEVQKRTAKLEEVTSRVSKYVSPQLYKKIYSEEANSELSYSRKKLTIFFSDIAGFTETTENLAPEDLSRILNQYLDAMAGIALSWGGTIDKYIGDAILIFFGDPDFTSDRDHAVRCVGMAREMLGKLAELRVDWEKAGITTPLHIRIGVSTGYCTVGNFGSESRMDYTVIGSTVNLASRLQTAASLDSILISEPTYLLIKESFPCEHAGAISLKGFDQPVIAFRVLPEGSHVIRELTEVHTPGLDLRINPSLMSPEERRRTESILKKALLSLSE